MESPTAEITKKVPGVLSIWTVKFPRTSRRMAATYYVTTYPDSDLIYIETVKLRPVRGRVLESSVRQAIARASA